MLDNPCYALRFVHQVCPDNQVSLTGWLVGRVNAGEVRQFTASSLTVQSLGVALLCNVERHIDIDFDNSGYGIKVFKTVEMASMDSPTTCKMKRP